MKIDLVVFDIAGTTVTDHDSVNNTFRSAFEKAGYPVALADVNQVMGYRKIEAVTILLERFYPEQAGNEKLIQFIHTRFTKDMKDFYVNIPDLDALPFAEDMFRLLHANHIKVALDTGFTKEITRTIMERLGWKKSGLVDSIVSSDEVPQGRPSPHMIRAIMDQLHISDSKLVAKIGDTAVDIEEGRNAGCGWVIGITTGAFSKEELEKFSPDHIIGSLRELPAILNLKA